MKISGFINNSNFVARVAQELNIKHYNYEKLRDALYGITAHAGVLNADFLNDKEAREFLLEAESSYHMLNMLYGENIIQEKPTKKLEDDEMLLQLFSNSDTELICKIIDHTAKASDFARNSKLGDLTYGMHTYFEAALTYLSAPPDVIQDSRKDGFTKAAFLLALYKLSK